MLRSSLTLAGLVALCATSEAYATQSATSKVRPINGPVRDAGIYHAATNTWTRKASTANIGADIIYNNTFTSGYFSPMTGDRFSDEGRIPSTSSPTTLSSRPGCANSYTVDGVQYAYCTDQPGGGAWTLNFYQTYTACTSTLSLTPTGTVTFTGPSTPTLSVAFCWIVTVDLDAAPPTITMLADGDGTYSGSPNANLFGWAMTSNIAPASQAGTGPVIAGDPNVSQQFDGTAWDSPVNYNEPGTGMSTLDLFYVENGPTTPGCYFFGGVPFASFHLELYADACGPTAPGVGFCFGDGTGLLCPCSPSPVPNGAPGNGCPNSVNAAGANLAATGTASISADTVVLNATGTPNSSVLFFQGTTQAGSPAGNGTAFGDGKRCAGGTVIRLGTKTAVAGASSYPVGADLSVSVRGNVTVPGTRTYQAWYRNAATFCTAATFNLSNGYEIAWGA
jgi:hypothetical protein